APVLKRQRRLTLDDAARLTVELRDEQVRQFGQRMQGEGIHPGPNGGGEAFDQEDAYLGAWEMLRVYAALSPPQRQALVSGGRIPLDELPVPARQRLEAMVERQRRRTATPTHEPLVGLLFLTVETRRREVVAADERTIQVRVRRLGGPPGEEPVPLHPTTAATAPPGAAAGGEILQELRFHLDEGRDPDKETLLFLHL